MIAIDLGSNTIRFIEYDGKIWGKRFEKIVKTAESLYETGKIGENGYQRIIDAIVEAKSIFDFSIHEVVGYTTAAMRMALNSHEIIEKIAVETNVKFVIIDPKKEAYLTLMAVRYRLNKLALEPTSFILADIGGGSTELIHCDNDHVVFASLNYGIVTLSERSATSELLRENLIEFKKQVSEAIEARPIKQLVLTAGTPTTIAAYINGMDYESYDQDKINGYRLSLAECFRAYHELLDMEEPIRAKYVGIGREKLIVAGILMVTAIFEAFECNDAIIIDDGLREGIALEYFESLMA
ncbi:MAG: phosphatase [Sulfuricurvum sp.]|nr:phosphatase [Sulfuricurvum sp.]